MPVTSLAGFDHGLLRKQAGSKLVIIFATHINNESIK